MTNGPNQSAEPINPVTKAIIWIGSSAVSLYLGLTLLIPAVTVGVILWIGHKTIHDKIKRLFLPAFSVLTMQLLMQGFGLIFIGKMNEGFVVDIVAVVASAIGLIWLIIRPGLSPLVLLGIVEILRVLNSILVMVMLSATGVPAAFPELGEGIGTFKSYVLNLMLSALAIVLMILAYLNFRKSTNVAGS